MNRFLFVVAMFFAFAALMSCDRHEVHESKSERRLVALSPAVAIILKELGCEREIVGRHGFDLVLKPELPVCGDQTGINYERLLALNPTHVVTEWGFGGPPEQLKRLSVERDWRLHDSTLRTPDDIVREVRALGAFADADPATVTATLARINAAWTRDESLSAKGRVLLLADVAQPSALGPGSFHHEILIRIGATAAITDGGPYQHLTLERITSIDPDVIVMVLPRAPTEPLRELSKSELIAALGRIGELDVSAVRTGCVLLVDDPGALTPSTAMIDFAIRVKSQMQAIK